MRDVLAVGCSVPFSRWASGAVKLGNRPPTAADLETHLSTLFPPVRLRGYLEVRYLDMSARVGPKASRKPAAEHIAGYRTPVPFCW